MKKSKTKKPKALLLLSGGFDSPVAGYLMQKQRVKVIALHFSNKIFAGEESERKSRELAKYLKFAKFISVDISESLALISKKCDRQLYFVLMKRLMLKLAEKIAKKEKCDFLITGENLGQVSSQTLQNLGVIDRAVKIPIIRPLLTYDKSEIIDTAKNLGTYEISKGPEHCDALGPEHPSTNAKEYRVLEEEKKLNFENNMQ